jgi:hypothetical protein
VITVIVIIRLMLSISERFSNPILALLQSAIERVCSVIIIIWLVLSVSLGPKVKALSSNI